MTQTTSRAPEQDLLSAAALTAFRLNGQFLSLAERLARPAGLTAARWQVLGAVLDGPATVAAIARTMGITRQSVQRIANLLVADGLAEYADNPSHRRAKLVAITADGLEAIRRIGPHHARAAAALAAEVGIERLQDCVGALRALSAALSVLDA